MNKNWRPMLDEYNSASLALNRGNDDWLIRIFQVHPGWKIDFQDEEVVLFVRTDTTGARDAHAPIRL
jgi:hypothetical protein